jgi:type III restriction enzyme
MYLFSQLKRIARQWLDGSYLRCSGGTYYPAQLIYQDIADRACERIKAAITESMAGEHPVKAVLDPYNPTGSTVHVRFDTAKPLLFQTAHDRRHVNYVTCDGNWEAEFCRAAEANRRVRAYVKNQGLGFEVPYLLGAAPKKYLPDFIVRVDDGHGNDDLLNLVVEIKGYRGEDAKDKANTMDAYWVPGMNNLRTFGRWAFAEFKESVYAIAANFDALIERFAA